MSRIVAEMPDIGVGRDAIPAVPSAIAFASAALALMAGSALLAGWAPLGFAIAILFLFAGPHNWMELRYFLARMPARWGKLWGFFSLGLGGVLVLSTASFFLPWLAAAWPEAVDGLTLLALWNSAVVLWGAALVHLRSRQNPRRDWAWTHPIALALLVLGWLFPLAWYVGILYGHPLLALWMLDRELARQRPDWRRAYHGCLLCLPVFLAALWFHLADAPPFPGDDALTASIARGAGANVLDGVSVRLLVATHAFLSMIHYGVWVIALPMIGLSARLWQVRSIPLARRSVSWRTALALLLAAGLGVVMVLWLGFLADYQLTRDVYLAVAIVHILAEVPFLLRSL